MLKYKLDGTRYVMFDETTGDWLWSGDEVSIAFSVDRENDGSSMWTLHKHGDPDMVEKWFTEALRKFREAGFNDMADDLKMVRGKFPVSELNRAIDTSGYIKVMLERLKLEVA